MAQFSYLASLPNEYVYQGMATPALDLFFTATVPSLKEARALTEVDGVVAVAPKDVDLKEMAFLSNREAVRIYVERQRREARLADANPGCANGSGMLSNSSST